MTDYALRNHLFFYTRRYGNKITDRRCFVDPGNDCDMKCPQFKIRIHKTPESVYAECFCYKVDPPFDLEKLKIYPLPEKEENTK